jgi:hypothetical protein
MSQHASETPHSAGAPASGVSPAPVAGAHERRTFVRAAIAAALLLFLVAEAVLYYRWATVREPTCVLIVDASPALRGAEVTVDNPGLSAPHKVTIGDGGRYAIPFYVRHGTYTVEVKLNEAEVYRAEVVLTPAVPGKKLDLTQFRPPATSPAASTAAY